MLVVRTIGLLAQIWLVHIFAATSVKFDAVREVFANARGFDADAIEKACFPR